jgi:hypothetical protein
MARHPQATQRGELLHTQPHFINTAAGQTHPNPPPTYPTPHTAHLKQLEQQINVPAPALFAGAASLFAFLFVMALGFGRVALLVGFLYPLLGTLKAVKVEEPVVMVRACMRD